MQQRKDTKTREHTTQQAETGEPIQFQINGSPPTKIHINRERDRIKARIRQLNTYNTALTIFTTTFFTTALCLSVQELQKTIGIDAPTEWMINATILVSMASVFLGYPTILDATTEMEDHLQRLAPAPKKLNPKAIRLCNMHPACEKYRQAVAKQDRQLLLVEFHQMMHWHRTKASRQRASQIKEAA